jgi:hypothetical protein
MRELTQEEIARVESRRKPANQLPTYYDPVQQITVRISRDFEAWLILTPLGIRASIATWLSQLAQNTPRDITFDDLAAEFAADEARHTEIERREYDTILSAYDQFRGTINTAGFEDISELGSLLSQTHEGLGRVSASRESAVFSHAMALANKDELEFRRVDTETQQALRSWMSVLLSYA